MSQQMKTIADYPQIFDGYANVKDDLASEEAKIEALADPEREIFFACIAAVKARTAGSAREFKARANVRTLQSAFDESVMAFEQARPPHLAPNQADLVRQTTAAQKPGYKPLTADEFERDKLAKISQSVKQCEATHAKIKSEEIPGDITEKEDRLEWKAEHSKRVAMAAAQVANAKRFLADTGKLQAETKANMETLNASLAEARAELHNATNAQRGLELASGNAIDAWRRCLPQMTAEAVHRKMCFDEAQRKIAAGPQPVVEKVFPSELDRALYYRKEKQKANRLPVYHGPR